MNRSNNHCASISILRRSIFAFAGGAGSAGVYPADR